MNGQRMLLKVAKILLGAGIMMGISACNKLDETHKDTIEYRLIKSFEGEKPELRQQITEVVNEAKADHYKSALNKLALISASHTLTREQEKTVDIIVRQLRYDMEEKIFTKQTSKQ